MVTQVLCEVLDLKLRGCRLNSRLWHYLTALGQLFILLCLASIVLWHYRNMYQLLVEKVYSGVQPLWRSYSDAMLYFSSSSSQ